MVLISEVRDKIEQYILAHPEFNRESYALRMSSAGFCPRLLDIMLQRGPSPKGLKSSLRLMMGEPVHHVFRTIFQEIYGDDFILVEEEINLTLSDGTVVPGHPDGKLHSLNAIVEFKGVSDNSFTALMNQGTPYAQHYEQGNIYAHVTNSAYILFVYINRDTGDFDVMLAPYSMELAHQTITKWEGVMERKRGGQVLRRPYNDATQAPCFYCDEKEDCYQDFKDEVKGLGVAEPDDEGFKRLATGFFSTRAARLTYEKGEDEIKKKLADWMIANSLNKAMATVVGSTKVEIGLKIGTKNNPLISLKERK